MEIKVGQEWKHKFEKKEAVTILNILEGKNKYIEYKYNNDDTVYILSDHIFSLIFTLIPPFRPHWLLDDGTKIYADEIGIKKSLDNFYELYNTFFKNNYVTFEPNQHKNEETDFGILFNNGSHMWARWIGEDND